MLCESCHQREATCHVTWIIGDVRQKRDLCPECFEASSPDAGRLACAQRDAMCEYCGGQPCAGDTDFFAMVTGVQKLRFIWWFFVWASASHHPAISRDWPRLLYLIGGGTSAAAVHWLLGRLNPQ